MIYETALKSTCYIGRVVHEISLSQQLHARKYFTHNVLRNLPVFPELQDYPTSIPVTPKVYHPPRVLPRYQDKQVEILTCGDLYRKWSSEKRYWKVPKDNINFEVRYMDTGCSASAETSPVVVALHGSPGSYDDFTEITERLHGDGVRVIAPKFPDISTYKMGRFRHTPEEKSEYVRDFLDAIEVPRVDLLLCHSSSLFPGLLLTLNSRPDLIKSLSLLNPTAFDMPRIMRPYPVIKFFARMFEFPVGNQIAEAVGKLIVGGKKELKTGRHLDHFLSAFTMIFADVTKRDVHFKELVKKKFPIMLAFSENDKLISKTALYKMANMILDHKSDIWRYNEDGTLEKSGGTNPSKKVLVFEKGTHFVFKKHPDVIADEIKSFLFHHFVKH